MVKWDSMYSKVESLWGTAPKDTLVQYIDLIPKEGKILDLGIGEGRNALFLASKGFIVDGVDISKTAVERCLKNAKEANLDINAEVGDLMEYKIEQNSYSLIILSNVLNFLRDDEIGIIINKVRDGLKNNGLIYIDAFDVNDPMIERYQKKFEEVSKNTFYRPKLDTYIHFFTKEELEQIFINYKKIKESQMYFLDTEHGEAHYHSCIEMLDQK
ncbi:MAG: class I SAM-dependent methyltransferase [Bacillota bacterium]|nr:class I SAM-dependent methyltransferase [Bacillota bacterium]